MMGVNRIWGRRGKGKLPAQGKHDPVDHFAFVAGLFLLGMIRKMAKPTMERITISPTMSSIVLDPVSSIGIVGAPRVDSGWISGSCVGIERGKGVETAARNGSTASSISKDRWVLNKLVLAASIDAGILDWIRAKRSFCE